LPRREEFRTEETWSSGHERPEVEKVIDEREGWLVVEKTGMAGAVADQEDPHSD
jgi:hypothetical protein